MSHPTDDASYDADRDSDVPHDPSHPVQDPAAHADDVYANETIDFSAAPPDRDEEMTRLRGEVDQANKRVLQAQAEAENFRKRMRRDYEDQLRFAAVPLVKDLLQVRDNLLRAIEASANTEAAAGLRDGVAIVVKQLDETLAKHGITAIPAAGEVFDPNIHEAITQMPSNDLDAGMVAHVAVDGFRMHDRVVRPAQVVVSTGSPA